MSAFKCEGYCTFSTCKVVFTFAINYDLHYDRLHPHKEFPGWEREVNGWRGLYRHETMTGNMAGIGLPRNGGPGLHVWLVGMLVTSFLLQRTHCIFFPCWFLWLCRTPPVPFCTWSMVHFAVGIWVWGLRGSFSIWKMLNVALLAQGCQWCCPNWECFSVRWRWQLRTSTTNCTSTTPAHCVEPSFQKPNAMSQV